LGPRLGVLGIIRVYHALMHKHPLHQRAFVRHRCLKFRVGVWSFTVSGFRAWSFGFWILGLGFKVQQ
jgi:hypothetical protein